MNIYMLEFNGLYLVSSNENPYLMNLIKACLNWINRIIAFACIITFVSLTGCKCDDVSNPDCPNFDPCFGESSNFADFKMEERIVYLDGGEYFQTDTTLERNHIRFSLYNENIDSVHWTIGLDPKVRIEKSFDIYFEHAFGDVEITAIAYKSSASKCFGEQSVIDTVKKTLHIMKWWEAPYFGTFNGIESEFPNTEFVTIIDTISNYRGAPDLSYTTLLTNFPNGYSMPVPVDGWTDPYQPWSIIGYKGFLLHGADDLIYAIGNYNNKSKELKCTYYFNPRDGSDWDYDRYYIGAKLN